MVKFFSIILLLLFQASTMLSAQEQIADTLNLTNTEGKRNGWWCFYYPNGLIKEKGIFKNGHKEGVWRAFYPDGNLKHEITFDSGIAKGHARFFREDGTLWEEGTWNETCWTGDYNLYHPNGQKAYEWRYNEKGRRTGIQKYYHANGKVKYKGKWENGNISGNVEVYNEMGTLTATRQYNEGAFSKMVPEATPLPQSADRAPADNNSPFHGTGYHTISRLDGKIEKKGYFRDGHLYNGKYYIYNKKDSLTEVRIFENGKTTKVEHP